MNKYNAKKTWLDGHCFDSKREAERYSELALLWKNGDIEDLKIHERYPLVVNNHLVCTYEADFVYTENGQEVVEDVKGFRTDVYKLKKKLMLAVYGIRIQEAQ